MYIPPSKRDKTDVYIDDIWSKGDTEEEAEYISNVMEAEFAKNGKPANKNKKVFANQFPVVYGWGWNLRYKEIRLPYKKANKYINLFEAILRATYGPVY